MRNPLGLGSPTMLGGTYCQGDVEFLTSIVSATDLIIGQGRTMSIPANTCVAGAKGEGSKGGRT
jgi:hypothetical protein